MPPDLEGAEEELAALEADDHDTSPEDTQMTHPEETCQRCGRPNIWSWSVDSDRFNVAVQALGLTVAAIICPVCFAEGHQKATGLRCTWRLIPADGGFHFPPGEIQETPEL